MLKRKFRWEKAHDWNYSYYKNLEAVQKAAGNFE